MHLYRLRKVESGQGWIGFTRKPPSFKLTFKTVEGRQIIALHGFSFYSKNNWARRLFRFLQLPRAWVRSV